MTDVSLGRAVVDFDGNLAPLNSAIAAAQTRVGAATRTMTTGFTQVGRSAGAASRVIGGDLLGSMQRVAGVSFGQLLGGAGLLGIVGGSIKAAMSVETLMVSYTRLTGSMDKAQALMSSTRKLANMLGQDFTSVAGAVRDFGIKGTALKDIPGIIEALSDAAGGSTEIFKNASRAFTQVMGKGFLSAEEMNQQFSEANITVEMIAAGLTKVRGVAVSTSQVYAEMTKKSITAAEFAKALVLGVANSSVGGTSREIARSTFGGQLQVIKNDFAEIGATVGEVLLPYLREVGDEVKRVTDFLKTEDGKKFLQHATETAIQIGKMAGGTALAIGGVQVLEAAWRNIAVLVAAVAATMTAMQRVGYTRRTGNVIGAIEEHADGYTATVHGTAQDGRSFAQRHFPTFSNAGAAMGAAARAPWQAAAGGVATPPLRAAFMGGLRTAGAEVVGVLGRIIPLLLRIVPIVLLVAGAITLVVNAFSKTNKEGTALSETLAALKLVGGQLLQAIGDLIMLFVAAGSATEAANNQMANLGNSVGNLLVPVIAVLADAIQLVVGLLSGDWDRIWSSTVSILLDVVDACMQVTASIMNILTLGYFGKQIANMFKEGTKAVRDLRQELHETYMTSKGFDWSKFFKKPKDEDDPLAGFDADAKAKAAAEAAKAEEKALTATKTKASESYWSAYSGWYGNERRGKVADLRNMEPELRRLRSIEDPTEDEKQQLINLTAEYDKLYRAIQEGDKLIVLQREHLEDVKRAGTEAAIAAADVTYEREKNKLLGDSAVLESDKGADLKENLRTQQESADVLAKQNDLMRQSAAITERGGGLLAINADDISRARAELTRLQDDTTMDPTSKATAIAQASSRLADLQAEGDYIQLRTSMELDGIALISQERTDEGKKAAQAELETRLSVADNLRERAKRDTDDRLAATLRAIDREQKAREELLNSQRTKGDVDVADRIRVVEREMAIRQDGETRTAMVVGGAYAEEVRVRHQAERLDLDTAAKRASINTKYLRELEDARTKGASSNVTTAITAAWRNELRQLQQDRELTRLQLSLELDKSALESWKDSFLTFMNVSVLRNPYFQQGLRAGLKQMQQAAMGGSQLPTSNFNFDTQLGGGYGVLQSLAMMMQGAPSEAGFQSPLAAAGKWAQSLPLIGGFFAPQTGAPSAATATPLDIRLTITNNTDKLFEVVADIAGKTLTEREAENTRSVRF